MLLDLNPCNAVIVYISIGVLSLIVEMDLVTNNQVTLTVMREMFYYKKNILKFYINYLFNLVKYARIN